MLYIKTLQVIPISRGCTSVVRRSRSPPYSSPEPSMLTYPGGLQPKPWLSITRKEIG
jgi:hypothetical protein